MNILKLSRGFIQKTRYTVQGLRYRVFTLTVAGPFVFPWTLDLTPQTYFLLMGTYFSDINQITKPLKAPVLTIGNFDGIHLGHQSLIQKVRERAKAIKGTPMVITFHPHPAQILRPGKSPKQIVSDDNKVDLIFQYGIEAVLSIPFTREFS